MKLRIASMALMLFAALGPAGAQRPDDAATRRGQIQVYEVPLYKSTIVPLDRAAVRVSVGNPGVADILVIRSRELYVVGKALGSTNVVVWDESGRAATSFDIEVTHDLDTLKTRLYMLLPGENISAQSAQEQLILGGQVSSAARASAAVEIARGFLPDCIAAVSDAPGAAKGSGRPDPSCKKGAVVNLMQVGGSQQVMLKVTVAEMAHSVVKRLDSNLNLMRFGSRGRLSGGAISGGASFPDALDQDGLARLTQGTLASGALGPIGPNVDLVAPVTPTIDATGLFLGYLEGNTFLQAVLDVSKTNGTAKILSEPTLTTLTGQEAQFLSGGEFPVPVPQGGVTGGVTVEFKEFGVGLKFTPVVLDSGRINLALNVAVSEVSGENAVAIPAAGSTSTFLIPSLTKRSAMSTVELGDGQTIGIAGLINDNMREVVQKFPVLGDLPIIGALFRSQDYRQGNTELVIFVTPQLAKPIDPRHYRLPTDGFVPPSDLDFYLLGRMSRIEKRPASGPVGWGGMPVAPGVDPLPEGSYGHDLGRPKPKMENRP